MGCFFHNYFEVLRGGVGSNHSTVRWVAGQQPFKLFDVVDQKLPEATGERVLCFLIVLITGVGHHDIFNFGKKKKFFFFFFFFENF